MWLDSGVRKGPRVLGARVSKILLVAAEPGHRERLRLALERLEADEGEVEFLEAVNGDGAFAIAEGRCWMAIRISSGSVRTPSLALSWVQVLATVL